MLKKSKLAAVAYVALSVLLIGSTALANIVYVANTGTDSVLAVNNTPHPYTMPFGPTLGGQPFDLAFDSSGNLYVDYGANPGTIDKITPGGALSVFATGLNSPRGLAFDKSGNLYAANLFNNTISEITPSGVVSQFASGVAAPCGLAFDQNGNLYAANEFPSSGPGTGTGTTIQEITPEGVVSTFATGLDMPMFLTFDSAGNLYASSASANTISKITPGGAVSQFSSGLYPGGIACDSNDQLYVVDNSNSVIYQIDTTTESVGTFANAGLSGGYGIALGVDVPEPSAFSLLALSGLALLRRRK